MKALKLILSFLAVAIVLAGTVAALVLVTIGTHGWIWPIIACTLAIMFFPNAIDEIGKWLEERGHENKTHK